jgi:serine/threonine protein kinase/WD40 repeat protein
MGIVFVAEDPDLKRRVALKVMNPLLAVNETSRTRFIREAQAVAAIDHDHIVHIYQVGEDRGVPYMAMQLLKGESLEEFLHHQPHPPLQFAVRIARETVLALAAAHEVGLIHRDIKPGNIWLESRNSQSEKGNKGEREKGRQSVAPIADSPSSSFDTSPRVKVLDFGLVRTTAGEKGPLTQSGAVMGTPAYMSPEQASGATVDARSDLFSLGCVLYRLCTGESPFRRANNVSTLLAVATHDPKPPTALSSTIPGRLSELIMQLLAKDPAGRPAGAADVASALATLERDLTQSPNEATLKRVVVPEDTDHSTLVDSTQKPRSKNKRALAIVAAIVIVAILGVVSWWIIANRIGTTTLAQGTSSQSSSAENNSSSGHGGRSPTIGPDKSTSEIFEGNLRPGADDPAFPGLVPVPARLPGIRRWQIQTAFARENAFGSGGTKIAISPEGALVAYIGMDGQVRIFDAATTRPVHIFPRKTAVSVEDVKWDAAGSQLAVVNQDGWVQIYDVARSRLGASFQGDLSVSWSPDGKQLATCSRFHPIRVWRAGDGARQKEISQQAPPAETFSNVEWGPGGLAVLNDHAVALVDLDQPKVGGAVKIDAKIRSVHWSPKAAWVAVLCEAGEIRLWKTDEKDKVEKLDGSLRFAGNLAWRPDGEQFAVSGTDADSKPVLATWSIGNDTKLVSSEPCANVTAMAWGKLGVELVTIQSELVRIDGKNTATQKLPVDANAFTGLAWSPDASFLATGSVDGVIRTWNFAASRPGPNQIMSPGHIWVLAWHPDNKRLAFSDSKGDFRLWNVTEQAPARALKAENFPLGGAAWTPDGGWLVYSQGQTCWGWHAEDDTYRKIIDEPLGIAGVALSPDGKRVALKAARRRPDEETFASVYSFPDGKAECELAVPNSFAMTAPLYWSPDGKQLASFHSTGKQALVWDLPQQAPAHRFDRPGHDFSALAWRPNGKELTAAVGSNPDDNAILHLKPQGGDTGLTPTDFPGWHSIFNLAWHPAGKPLLLMAGQDHTLRLWDSEKNKIGEIAVTLPEGRSAFIRAGGDLSLSDPDHESDFVYVVEREDGTIDMLTPAQFRRLVK